MAIMDSLQLNLVTENTDNVPSTNKKRNCRHNSAPRVNLSYCCFSLTLTTLPGGLVVRIRRSHRRGRGSIPRLGKSFFVFTCFLSSTVIATQPNPAFE